MKRKYFLRGTGLGILITAMVFILLGQQKMSDEEVIKRAKELGYVKAEEVPSPTINIDELLEKELTPAPTKEPMETVTPQPTESAVTDKTEPSITPEADTTPEPSGQPDVTDTPESSDNPDVADTPEPSAAPEITDVPEQNNAAGITEAPSQKDAEFVRLSFEVTYGSSVAEICEQLEEKGIVDSASKFRKYLADNNLDYTIRAGLYIVSSDMSYEELAKVLRRKKNE